jgi:hypothetical protein
MTQTPEWGAELTRLIESHLRAAHEKHGLRCALRVTPTDIRDQGKPPLLRRGNHWETLKRSFELCVEAGAHLVSIESIGGKELHDAGLMYGDIRAIVFALGVRAPRDTAWLWDQISAICAANGGSIPAGDSACAFANTAMQLAGQHMLPEVLAAVVRAMSAVRSLAAFEHGAVGPSKDCAYEGPIIKAIFIVAESARAESMARALSAGDRPSVARLCTDSFAGVRDLYEICSPPMVAMMDAMLAPPGVIGARQAGAGFGGCMVALVDTACSDAFRAAVMDAYRSVTNVMPEIYPVEAAAGAEVLVGK